MKKIKKADLATRKAFSQRMVEYGEVDKDFVVFEADIGYSTYSYLFGEKYPDRYFNMGIAESNTMGAAAGMAADGGARFRLVRDGSRGNRRFAGYRL